MAGSKGGWLQKIYYSIVAGENGLGHLLLLLIRLYWGVLFVMVGIGKWINIHPVADFFGGLSIPYPLWSAYLVGTFELLGGLSLILGLFSRLMTIPLIAILAIAYATAHVEALHQFFKNPSLFVAQQPFLYLLAALVVLCFGPGFFSIDYWIEKKTFGRAL